MINFSPSSQFLDKETKMNFAEWLESYSEHCNRAVKSEAHLLLIQCIEFFYKGVFLPLKSFLVKFP